MALLELNSNLPFQINILTLLRSFYLISASGIILVRLVPSLRARFLDYGPREVQGSPNVTSKSWRARLMDRLAAIKVPHSAFWHFYTLSSACTAFWLSHISHGGRFLYVLRQYVPQPTAGPTTSPAKIGLCILLYWVQAIRRLTEGISLTKDRPSTSLMWIGHYFIGLAFYFFTNVAIFIEHVHLVLSLDQFTNLFLRVERGPSLMETVAFITFVVASKKQHEYHVYLASLRKYTLPTQGAFRYIVAPHYTSECSIYLSLAVLSAPAGQHLNITMLCCLIFVAVNLGVTADGTKEWMLGKFPDHAEDIQKRWKMIPGLF